MERQIKQHVVTNKPSKQTGERRQTVLRILTDQEFPPKIFVFHGHIVTRISLKCQYQNNIRIYMYVSC